MKQRFCCMKKRGILSIDFTRCRVPPVTSTVIIFPSSPFEVWLALSQLPLPLDFVSLFVYTHCGEWQLTLLLPLYTFWSSWHSIIIAILPNKARNKGPKIVRSRKLIRTVFKLDQSKMNMCVNSLLDSLAHRLITHWKKGTNNPRTKHQKSMNETLWCSHKSQQGDGRRRTWRSSSTLSWLESIGLWTVNKKPNEIWERWPSKYWWYMEKRWQGLVDLHLRHLSDSKWNRFLWSSVWKSRHVGVTSHLYEDPMSRWGLGSYKAGVRANEYIGMEEEWLRSLMAKTKGGPDFILALVRQFND